MHILHKDDRPTLDLYAVRNNATLVPVDDPAKVTAELLVSTLTVLSAEEYLSLLDRGVHISTADGGIETRPYTNTGPLIAPVVEEFRRALTLWLKHCNDRPEPTLHAHMFQALKAATERGHLALDMVVDGDIVVRPSTQSLVLELKAANEREQTILRTISEELDGVGAPAEIDGRALKVGERLRLYLATVKPIPKPKPKQ